MKKLRIIKLSDNVFVYCLEDLWHEDKVQEIHHCITQTPNNSTIIGYLVWESVGLDTGWVKRVRQLYKQFGNRRFVLVLNTVYKRYDLSFPVEVVYIDYFLLRTHYEDKIVQRSKHNTRWNYNADKFLFLTGKCIGSHRVRLLYKLQQARLLDRCTWSLFGPENDLQYNKAREHLHELTDAEFDDFLKTYSRNPDSISLSLLDLNGTHYGGFPYNCTLFSETLFRVISETRITGYPWLTEKTWITILNHHPFIMAGQKGILKYLQEKGFKTFDQYLQTPTYDNISNVEDRLDTVVVNATNWISTCNDRQREIQADIEHNYRHFTYLAEQNIQVLNNVLYNVGVHGKRWHDVLPFYDQLVSANWRDFYENIKDPNWPDCAYEESFTTLPEHIQNECIEVYGYKPNTME